jgi:hypothetical protein
MDLIPQLTGPNDVYNIGIPAWNSLIDYANRHRWVSTVALTNLQHTKVATISITTVTHSQGVTFQVDSYGLTGVKSSGIFSLNIIQASAFGNDPIIQLTKIAGAISYKSLIATIVSNAGPTTVNVGIYNQFADTTQFGVKVINQIGQADITLFQNESVTSLPGVYTTATDCAIPAAGRVAAKIPAIGTDTKEIELVDRLPNQVGNDGKVLGSNGTSDSWGDRIYGFARVDTSGGGHANSTNYYTNIAQLPNDSKIRILKVSGLLKLTSNAPGDQTLIRLTAQIGRASSSLGASFVSLNNYTSEWADANDVGIVVTASIPVHFGDVITCTGQYIGIQYSVNCQSNNFGVVNLNVTAELIDQRTTGIY